jgi:hypothetical protein
MSKTRKFKPTGEGATIFGLPSGPMEIRGEVEVSDPALIQYLENDPAVVEVDSNEDPDQGIVAKVKDIVTKDESPKVKDKKQRYRS